MPPHDSDTSDEERESYTMTNVLLGYASEEPTDDSFSKLGGFPTWLDETSTPPAGLAKCQTCNAMMTLLLQINGDLPDIFPGHERRLYIFSCKRKACRRKTGSVRSIRGVRITTPSPGKSSTREEAKCIAQVPKQKTATDLGNRLFQSSSSKPSLSIQNPFSNSNSAGPIANPFSFAPQPSIPDSSPISSLPSKPAQAPSSDLPATFAEKARISSPPPPPTVKEPWPPASSLPKPYPTYYLDADHEALEPDAPFSSSRTAMDIDTADSNNKDDEKDAFESTIDKSFQKFADRLAQNPDQVLRYDFNGTPLLYSKSDAVGQLIARPEHMSGNSKITTIPRSDTATRIPRCPNCSAPRAFELQLVPHAIVELEREEEGLEGMEWGTILLYVCEKDCAARGTKEGEVSWVEEWTGVQWEEDVKMGKT